MQSLEDASRMKPGKEIDTNTNSDVDTSNESYCAHRNTRSSAEDLDSEYEFARDNLEVNYWQCGSNIVPTTAEDTLSTRLQQYRRPRRQ